MIAKGNGLSLAALALTGCFARDDVREPHKGVILYSKTQEELKL
jgi:hypothetical protein